MRTERITTIKKRFHREWLLIAVDKIDESTTTPTSGKILAHSPNREEIYRQLLKPLKVKKVLVEYSEDSCPKCFTSAF